MTAETTQTQAVSTLAELMDKHLRHQVVIVGGERTRLLSKAELIIAQHLHTIYH